ncbi:MAG: FG-GAP repeat protein [Planctomycetes bacterium]|nr:FG-GAP repeat protein [Planctomycetota bacterium]
MRATSLLFLSLFTPTLPAQIVGGEVQTIFRFDGESSSDALGQAVSGAGDVNGDGVPDLIAGAWSADPGGMVFAGSAYVYSGADGSVIYQYNGSAAYEEFGVAVSAAGDVNNDGFDDFIIGASGASPGGLGSAGSAFVYSGFNGSLLYQIDGADVSYQLGSSVSGAGDVNNDGFDDFIIGADSARSNGLFSSGSAFIYSGANGTLLFQYDGGAAWDLFGHSVSGIGDVNSDGSDDFIIGAFSADPAGISAAGSAYIYSGANGSLIYQYDGSAAFDGLGESVSAAGDVDGDGNPDFIIGAKGADVAGITNAGSAYVYSGATGLLLHEFNGTQASSNFGFSVSNAGDFNGDGFDDVLVGANGAAPEGMANAGSAFVYSGATGALLFQANGDDPQDFMGMVAAAGDVDGNGYDDVFVGASGDDPGFVTGAGSAFVYGHHPFLTANSNSISAATGATIDFDLNFPATAAADDYKILISATGAGPTTYGVEIPLTQDSVVIDTYLGNYPVPNHTRMHGTLDAAGNASASLTAPAGLPSGLIGNSYWLAAIANQPGQLPEYSSVAVMVLITP